MFTLQTFMKILAFLSFSVRVFSLSQRDVVAPPIIFPDASSVWPIGTQQFVIWNNSGLAQFEPSGLTGQINLGFNESIDLSIILASNFNITDGNVTITVPNVSPGGGYFIILFGDSGDTSAPFPITPANSSSSGSILTIPGATPSATSTSPATSTSTAVNSSTVPPITGTTTTGSTSSSNISNSASAVTSASTIHRKPTEAIIGGVIGGLVLISLLLALFFFNRKRNNRRSQALIFGDSGDTSALFPITPGNSSSSASSPTSAGWSLHHGSSLWSSAAPFLMSVAPFVMVFMGFM